MTELFADTSGWGNLVDASQPYHSLATAIYRAARQEGRKVITTNYVVAELVSPDDQSAPDSQTHGYRFFGKPAGFAVR